MNTRRFFSLMPVIACLAAATVVFVRSRELGNLREQQRQLLAQQDTNAGAQSGTVASGDSTDSSAPQSVSPELLRLRSQVGQLTERKRGLKDVTGENQRLHAQLAGRNTNSEGGVPLPPDYIRKSQAQWRGQSTPENAMQSFLWALEHRDMTNLLQVLVPKDAEEISRQFGQSPEKFFEEAASLPGLRIVRHEQMPDGSVKLEVEFVPGRTEPGPPPFTLRRFGADWRIQLD